MHSLTTAEENNEVNCFLGWALFDVRKKYTESGTIEGDARRELISTMISREHELDEEYKSEYYDTNVGMLNQGGLTIVNKSFFPFGKKLMQEIRTTFTEQSIEVRAPNCVGIAEASIMGNKNLSSQFTSLCLQHASNVNIKIIESTYQLVV